MLCPQSEAVYHVEYSRCSSNRSLPTLAFLSLKCWKGKGMAGRKGDRERKNGGYRVCIARGNWRGCLDAHHITCEKGEGKTDVM